MARPVCILRPAVPRHSGRAVVAALSRVNADQTHALAAAMSFSLHIESQRLGAVMSIVRPEKTI
jgi:hypothetical protein